MLNKSITWRLTLFFGLLSITVLILVGYIASVSVQKHFAEEDMNEIDGKLELIEHAVSNFSGEPGNETLSQQLDNALVGHHALSVQVYGARGKVLYSTQQHVFPEYLFKKTPAVYAKNKTIFDAWEVNGQVYRGVFVSIPTHAVPALSVAIALNTEQHQKFIVRFQQSLWFALLVGVFSMTIFGWVAARRGLSPIRDFDKVTSVISANRLNERIPLEVLPKELLQLGISFNEMLQRLQDAFGRLSAFSAEIAHELRTPVSNLMTQSQVALSKPRSAEEYQEVLYSNLEEFDRLSRMISDMLFLAKADNGLIIPTRERFDLGSEVTAVIEFYDSLIEEKSLNVVLSGNSEIIGDRLMLRRVISNLLSNAIRHSSVEQKIDIDISTNAHNQICLSIKNSCSAITQQQLERIFDRFYRVDPSRQRNNEGAGLGLAITKSIVEAHQGSISVVYENQIIEFVVCF